MVQNHPIALYVFDLFLFIPNKFVKPPLTTKNNSVFLPASDIPSFVGLGSVDLGITGHDVILESKMSENVTESLRLGFGRCALQVQVPEASAYQSADDLAGKRIVTSFEVLSGEYFGAIDKRLGLLKEEEKTRIEYVGGSVEAACALGLADGVGEWFRVPSSSAASVEH